MLTPQRREALRQILVFAAIGVVSTAAYATLYLLFRVAFSPTVANTAALIITAVGNTAANRRLTFGVTHREHLWRDHAAGLIAFGFALAITTGAATILGSASNVSRSTELAVLIGANAVATVARFLILRTVVNDNRSQPERRRVE
jgi:putative flippase GtrA